jgi:hypothetical protein
MYVTINKERISRYERLNDRLLGTLAELRKAVISFIMSVWPPVRLSALNNSASNKKSFMKFGI